MSTQAVVNLLAVGEASPVSRKGVSEHYALRVITSATNEFWFLGDPDDADKVLNIDPGADIRQAALASVPNYQEDGGFLSGAVSIGSGSYSLADIGHDGTQAFAERFANRQALRGALLVLYQANDDENFTEDTRIRTSFGRDMRDDEGELILDFESVHSLIRGKLFSPQKLRLAMSISESGESSGETIVIQLPENTLLSDGYTMPRFKHDDAYSVDPGKEICYWKTSENEIISAVVKKAVAASGPGMENMLVFPVHQRGLFGTKKKKVDVDLTAVPATYPEIEEFIFLEENPGDMLLLTMAGETADGRVPPAGSNYTKNLGKALFNLASFDYTGSLLERQHFAGLAEQDTKTFIDKRVLGEVFATLLDDVFGRFDFRTRASFADDGLSVETLDENNMSIDDGLVFETYTDNLRRVIFIKHGYNSITKSYEMADIRITTDTLPGGVYGELDDIDIEYQGWNTAVGTVSQLRTRAAIVQDLHHAPMVKTVVHLLPHMNHIRVGDIVTLDTRRIRTVYNSLSGEPVAVPPNLSMLVVAREGLSESRTTKLALVASTGNVERTSTNAQATALTDEEYVRIAPTLLSSVVTPTAGSGGRELYSGEHFVTGDTWYRIDNQAILDTTFKLKPLSPCEYIGIAHKDDLSVLSTVGAIDGKAYGAYAGTESVSGTPGAIGLTAADGGIDVVFRTDVSSAGTHTMHSFPQQGGIRGTLDTFTGLNLVMMGDRLHGLPRRAAGSGGQGGGRVTGKFIDAPGVDAFNQALGASPPAAPGGRGGMGAFFMGRRLAWSDNAVLFDVSGGSGSSGTHVVGGAVSGAGAGGSPGMAGIIVDGNHSLQPVKEGNVRAFNGIQIATTGHMSSVVARGNSIDFKQSFYQGTPYLNRWKSHTAVTFIPANDSVGDRPLNAFDQLALDEAGLDGKITLHLIPDTADPVFPRNADINDIAAYEVDASNLNLAVTDVRAYRLTSSGWGRIVFPDIIAEFKITAFRDRGSTVLWVRETRPPIGVYAVGDSWYHPGSRRMYVLGATASEDVLVSSDSFSDFTGFNLLVDPNWVDYASGMDTLSFHQRWDEPLRTEASAPTTPVAEALGQTSDSYVAVGAIGFDYKEEGSVEWDVSGSELVSSAGSSSGNARAFYSGTAGFLADSDPRKIWVYARSSGGTKTLIVQAAGATDGTGTPSQQQSVSISATANTWVLMEGLFGAYHSQIQLRTNDEGLYVSRVIAIDQQSNSTPYGEAGFGSAGSGGIVAARPFWAPPTTDDRKYPLKRGSSRGPFQLLDSGEGNSLAWRVDFSGATVPNIIVERFPWKAKPGTQYRAKVRMRIKVGSGFDNPNLMGVSAQIEGYDDVGKVVFTTGVKNGNATDWFSINGSAYTDLIQIVDVPTTVSRLAWGALKVVVMGNASGYAEIDSCEMVELPYRVREYFASQLNYYGRYNNNASSTTFLWTIPVTVKKGMRVITSTSGEAKTDYVNASEGPYFGMIGVFRSVDLFGNSLSNVGTYPETLRHKTGKVVFNRAYSTQINQAPPYLTTDYQAFSESSDFIAWSDINQLSMRITTASGGASSDLFIKGLSITINYGENFGDTG